MIGLTKIPSGYETLPGTDYEEFGAFIKEIRDAGLSVDINRDDESRMRMTIKPLPISRSIVMKIEDGEPLSEVEVETAHKFYTETAKALRYLGDTFRLPYLECQRQSDHFRDKLIDIHGQRNIATK